MKRWILIGMVVASGMTIQAQNKLPEKFPYQDTSLTAEERADDLLKRLTLEEKASLMMNGSPAIPRLSIKAYGWWNEALHGLARTGLATVFPQAIGCFGGSQENNWYWSYGTQFACNGYYASANNTGAGAIGRELINRIPDNDARKALFLTEDKFPGYDFNDGSAMDLTYGILGLGKGEEADLLWEDAAEYCQRMAVSGLAAPYQSGYMYLGGQLKFYVFDTPGVSYLPFIRSSEMVLIEAEANYFLNNEPDAQTALIELNATSGRNPEYTCTKTGEALWNEIMD